MANRAIDFLQQVGEESFVLVVSLDEPHGPYVPPPELADSVDPEQLPMRPNFGASTEGKPRLQQLHREAVWSGEPDWETYRAKLKRQFTDNAYIDREIGRVLSAVEEQIPGETTIIYTVIMEICRDRMGSFPKVL